MIFDLDWKPISHVNCHLICMNVCNGSDNVRQPMQFGLAGDIITVLLIMLLPSGGLEAPGSSEGAGRGPQGSQQRLLRSQEEAAVTEDKGHCHCRAGLSIFFCSGIKQSLGFVTITLQ